MVTSESFAEYKKDTRFISPSQIKGKKTPYHYYYDKFLKPKQDPTEPMILGSAYHCLLLEPHKFKQEYTFLQKSSLPYPDKDFKNASNRDFRDNAIRICSLKGLTLLTEDQMITLHKMKVALVQKYPELYTSIINTKTGLIEHNVYVAVIFDELGTLKEFVRLDSKEQVDLDFKGKRVLFLCTRPDFFDFERLYDLDLKTTQSAEPDDFSKDVFIMEYHIQATMGLEILSCEYGKDFKDFFFLAQEKTEPFMSANYHCSENMIEMGSYQYRLRLKHILEATEAGVFKGYEMNKNTDAVISGAIELYLPAWSHSKIMNSDF